MLSEKKPDHISQVEVEDEFGRMRRVGKEEAKRIKGIHVNLADDYKEYSTRQQYGYHMVPPPQALGGSLETELAIRMKNEEAKEEWRSKCLSKLLIDDWLVM